MKKSIVFLLVIFILIFLFSSPVYIAEAVNNIALDIYEREVLKQLELPKDTMIKEIISGCGNTSGTGNHTDLYVGILVRTTLSAEEWARQEKKANYVGSAQKPSMAMQLLDLEFTWSENGEGYYVLEYYKRAPMSAFDWRGH